MEDWLNTLRSYRRARGLCIHCGEKWSGDNRCSENIQLHVLQEFWDICHNECFDDEHNEEPTDAQVCLAISLAALNGHTTVSTMQFHGTVQGVPAKILLDSGSSHTFVSTDFSSNSKLFGQLHLHVPLSVKIADGQLLNCFSQFPQLEWSVQGCSFHSDAKILPLAHYDLIIGMDWLVQHSPMHVY